MIYRWNTNDDDYVRWSERKWSYAWRIMKKIWKWLAGSQSRHLLETDNITIRVNLLGECVKVMYSFSRTSLISWFIHLYFPLSATSCVRTHVLAARIECIADFLIRPRTFRITEAPAASQIGKQSPHLNHFTAHSLMLLSEIRYLLRACFS
jgi:hypothetical protein